MSKAEIETRIRLIEKDVESVVQMIADEYTRLMHVQDKIDKIAELNARQVAAIIGVEVGTFYNAKADLLDKGYFKDGLHINEAMEIGRLKRLHGGLAGIPAKEHQRLSTPDAQRNTRINLAK